MYNIYTTNTKDIVNRLKSRENCNSISKKQKEIFVNEIQDVKIINIREVFVCSFIFFVWYKSCITCIFTLKSGEKFIMDVSKKNMNTYFSKFI
jgi:hypothetical protein